MIMFVVGILVLTHPPTCQQSLIKHEPASLTANKSSYTTFEDLTHVVRPFCPSRCLINGTQQTAQSQTTVQNLSAGVIEEKYHMDATEP